MLTPVFRLVPNSCAEYAVFLVNFATQVLYWERVFSFKNVAFRVQLHRRVDSTTN